MELSISEAYAALPAEVRAFIPSPKSLTNHLYRRIPGIDIPVRCGRRMIPASQIPALAEALKARRRSLAVGAGTAA